MCDKPTDPDVPSDPDQEDDDDFYYWYSLNAKLCFPPNLRFPNYPPSVDVDDEDEEEDEGENRLEALLECIRKQRLHRSEGKSEPDEPEDKITESGEEEEESEPEEENESDSKEPPPLFNSSPSHNMLLRNYVQEPEDTESEDNESEGEGKDLPPLFDPAAGNPLSRILHVKDPVIEVEEWKGCPICGDLNKTHTVMRCPWLKKVPKDQRPGPRYDIYCIECGMVGQDCCSKGAGLVLKDCGLCWLSGHWAKTCPYYKPKNPINP